MNIQMNEPHGIAIHETLFPHHQYQTSISIIYKPNPQKKPCFDTKDKSGIKVQKFFNNTFLKKKS
jgi:hypothetical protein